MGRQSINALCAVILLLFCGVLFYASFDIRVTEYSTLQPSVWPRLIIICLGLSSALLLIRSFLWPEPATAGDDAGTPQSQDVPTVGGFARYRNALLIFGLFLAFLITLPWLGMLIGGMAFVFLTLTAIGHADIRSLLIHLAISVLSVGIMWAIFTYVLHVILPGGEIIPYL